MSSERALGLTYVAGGDVADGARVADAIVALFAACGRVPNRLTYSLDQAVTRGFEAERLRALIAEPRLEAITAWSEGDDGAPEVRPFLRGDPAVAEYESRQGGALVMDLARADALIAYLAELQASQPIATGGLAGFGSREAAFSECMQRGSRGPLDDATNERLRWDGRHRRRAWTRVRRLYPITIFGAEAWAALPPLPRTDPMPVVTQLGTCTLLTAWPTLCDPRDPAFLHGTRALRAWLWPHTIQNPADHVDRDPAR